MNAVKTEAVLTYNYNAQCRCYLQLAQGAGPSAKM